MDPYFLAGISSDAKMILLHKTRCPTVRYQRYSSLSLVKELIISLRRRVFQSTDISILQKRDVILHQSPAISPILNRTLPKVLEIDSPIFLSNQDLPYPSVCTIFAQFLKYLFIYYLAKVRKDGSRAVIPLILVSLFRSSLISKAVKTVSCNLIFLGCSSSLDFLLLSIRLDPIKSISTEFYLHQGHLSPQCSFLADRILLGNHWCYDSLYASGCLFKCKETKCLVNYYFPVIDKPLLRDKRSGSFQVAIYAASTYARIDRDVHTNEYYAKIVEYENLFLQAIYSLANQSQNIEYTLFPHPTVSSVADLATNWYYHHLLSLPNVVLPKSNEPTYTTYKDFDIGISLLSETAFERLQSGHKSLIVYREFEHHLIYSGLNKVILSLEQLSTRTLSLFLNMSTEEFGSLIGMTSL